MHAKPSYELQLIDTNCNDCIFMIRDQERFIKSLDMHYKMQSDEFNSNKQRLTDKAKWWRDVKGDLDKSDNLLNEVSKLKFQFDKKFAMINYGNCSKFNKQVSFIPNTCNPENQNCFKHRKDK